MQKREIEQFYRDVTRLDLRFPTAEIAAKTGYSKGNVSEYLRRIKEPGKKFLISFYEAFGSSLNVPHELNTAEMREDQRPYHKRRQELKNGDKPPVPIYGGFTTLGNITVYDDGGLKHRIVAELPPDVFPGCDYGERAKGDSMYPLIMNQALLVGKTCPADGIIYGEKYIIKTKDGKDTAKFVHPGSKPGRLVLKAYNKSIPDQEIHIADIVFVCRVHWIINPT